MKSTFNLLSLLFSLLLTHHLFAQGINNRFLFVSHLTGDQEVPSVPTNARGVVTLLVSEDRQTLSVHGVFTGLSGPITGCHIHDGIMGVNGPVSTDFLSFVSGNRLRADIPLPANFLSKGLKKALYVNVHTALHPTGEIRGQLVLMTDVQYAAILSGQEEVPPNATSGSGVFRLTYFPGNTKASYVASYNGLTGPATNAHIHSGAVGVSGPVVAPITPGLPNTYVGELDFTALAADFQQKLKDGLLYVNVHTAANPGGEIRGQLRPLGPITFETLLNGDQETPAVATSAIGTAVAALAPTLDTLTYYVSATGLTPTAAHFHIGAPGTAGPVMIPFAVPTTPNFYSGKVVLTPAQVTSLLKGDVYVNIHTAANPGGEIRGQMQSNLRRVYAFDLCGEQEVPSNPSGQGAAAVSVNHLNTNLYYIFIADGLSGAPTAAHIHNGAFGVNGPVLKPLALPTPVAGSILPINGDEAVLLESGNAYINVHTAANPGGEIRGQIRRSTSCSANVGVHDPVVLDLKVYPNPSAGQTEVRFEVTEAFDGQVVLMDLVGKTVYNENRTFGVGGQAFSLNLEGLPKGVYVAQVKSVARGVVGAFKVVRD